MMAVVVDGKQVCKSAGTHNKRIASHMLSRWETDVFERRFHLPKSTPPIFERWDEQFLMKVAHPNTRKRYRSSVGNLKKAFAGRRLTEISPEGIEEFGESRLSLERNQPR